MKSRNKEVNIFNMSLLDILCGALGAFCFMMLVLFQYWKPEPPDTKKTKVDTAAMEQKIQDLMKQMKGMSNLPPEAAERLQQMQQEFERLQGMTNQLKAQLQQAQAQAQGFQRQAQEAQAQAEAAKKEVQKLQSRNPVTVVMTTLTNLHDVDLYVKDNKMDPADPNKVQGRKWNGDVFYNGVRGPGSDVWMMRDAPAQEYRIYYKFLSQNGNAEPAVVNGYYLHNNSIVLMPQAKITKDHEAVYVGSIRIQPDMSSAFDPARPFAESYRQMLEQLRRNSSQPPPAVKKQ